MTVEASRVADHVAPVAPRPGTQRIVAIDVVRGVALLGILLVNIDLFGLPVFSGDAEAYGGFSGSNLVVWFLKEVFAEGKFITIFSMLFGAGVLLFTGNLTAKGIRPAPLHLRRMFWLLVFGLVHLFGIWAGDILTAYALAGAVVFVARRWRPAVQLAAGLALLVAATAAMGTYQAASLETSVFADAGYEAGFDAEEAEESEATGAAEESEPGDDSVEGSIGGVGAGVAVAPDDVEAGEGVEDAVDQDAEAAEVALFQSADWPEQTRFRIALVVDDDGLLWMAWEVVRVLALMAIGMALFTWGVLTGKRSRAFFVRLAVFAGIPGLAVSAGFAASVVASDFDGASLVQGWGWYVGILAPLPVALAYVALIQLWCRSSFWRSLQDRMAAVGRMAFTNYLAQSLLATTFFYGYGFGRFGRFDRTALLAVVVVVWALELAWSPWWLARFRFGPMEWLWRSLTYWRPQPFRRAPADATG